ncbi:MAG: hypothetical protein QOJ26_720 [Thermoplasmata archaeon]|jgi:hypothetical protein|nr:hypothetical protein [Thermoplasmata archaeon]MEA3165854.1 hypothetical protein [Thermoplasmata archaeon]
MTLKAVPALLLLAIAALAAVPTASAGVPEPICQIPCMIVFNIVLPCANAEAQQTVYGNGAGCSYTNGVQDAADCFVRNVEAQAGVAEACP